MKTRAHVHPAVAAAIPLVVCLATPAIAEEGRSAAARARAAAVASASVPIERALRSARAASDVERVACLSEVLSQSHAAARWGRALAASVELAESAGDAVLAERELVRLDHLRARAARLGADAFRCIAGAPIGLPEGTVVRVVAPPLPDHPAFPTP